MKVGEYDSVYFLGIGGIGMSALARWYKRQGLSVSGYDRTPTPLTETLQKEGMAIHFVDEVQNIPLAVIENPARTLVILTPAIPKDHQEWAYLKEKGFTIIKRSEALGLLSQQHPTLAVAGTHGKTTTSSMVAHILKYAKKRMVAFLGGITTNYASNLLMEGDPGVDTVVVAEADEFDRSFLRLFPQWAIVTSADPDHLDIYGKAENVVEGFKDFIGQIQPGGTLIYHQSLKEKLGDLPEGIRKITYGINQGQFFASNIISETGFFEFDLCGYAQVIRIKLGVPGFHNVENAVSACVVANLLEIDWVTIQQALSSFSGVKRRFEYVLKKNDIIFIDDYAHHPTEIEAFLKSLRAMYMGKKITVVFQPHLYTRTRDFASGFSGSLSLADEVLLLDIYPARELPIPGVDSDMIFHDIKSRKKIRCNKKSVLEEITRMDIEVLATLGAGDIDALVEPIRKLLEEKYA